jgi:hypothetical protein
MPSLSFFIDEDDLYLLIDRLNADPEIAFIVPDDPLWPEDGRRDQTPGSWGHARSLRLGVRVGEDGKPELYGERGHDQRWKAVQAVDALKDGQHSLWHVPAGPLPLLKRYAGPQPPTRPLVAPPDSPIPDPWAGWTAPPGFGPGCHPWIRLALWTRHRPYTEQERTSLHELISFWFGNDDMLVVSGFQWTGSHFRPAPTQTQQWWNRMRGWVDRTAVKLRADPSSCFWAFPSALRKLKNGMRYYSRNFDLDDTIRNTELP